MTRFIPRLALASVCVLACLVALAPPARGAEDKIETSRGKLKFNCGTRGQHYGYGPRDMNEREWKNLQICKAYVRTAPAKATLVFSGGSGLSMRIFEHDSGYYLLVTAHAGGFVRPKIDPLMLELENGSSMELQPFCDASEGSPRGMYELSEEQLRALSRSQIVGIKLFLVSSGRSRRSHLSIQQTEDGREYVEPEAMPQLKYSLQPWAVCLLKTKAAP